MWIINSMELSLTPALFKGQPYTHPHINIHVCRVGMLLPTVLWVGDYYNLHISDGKATTLRCWTCPKDITQCVAELRSRSQQSDSSVCTVIHFTLLPFLGESERNKQRKRLRRKNGKLIKHVKTDPYIKIKAWAESYQRRNTHIPRRQCEIDIKRLIL